LTSTPIFQTNRGKTEAKDSKFNRHENDASGHTTNPKKPKRLKEFKIQVTAWENNVRVPKKLPNHGTHSQGRRPNAP
jgi:hypothetical protein